jgi:hypothetical protein
VLERRHLDEGWREVRRTSLPCPRGLMDADIKASEMWGNQESTARKIKEMHSALGTLWVELDNEYHHEKRGCFFDFPDPIFGADRRIRSREVLLE